MRTFPHDDYPVIPRLEDWAFPLEEFQGLYWRCPKGSDQDQVQPTSQPARSANQMPSPARPPSPDPHIDPISSILLETHRCIISNVSCLIQSSHIIPQALESCFTRNYMERFGGNTLSIHSPLNRVNLRHNLHYAWDCHMFVLVPKQSELKMHVLNYSSSHGTCEFAAQWHNVPASKAALKNVPDEYLFAKFAQAIFILLKPYITRGFSRPIARLNVSADGDLEQSVDKLTGDMLKNEYGGGGSVRSSSASSGRKRSYPQATQGNSDDGHEHPESVMNSRVDEWVLDQEFEGAGSYLAWHANENENLDTAAETPRGRLRKRRSVPPPRRDL
jgi:hypothetical protein